MSETTISSENYRSKVDFRKLEQVLHYIIQKVGILPNVGKTVLMKYLYFCDFDNMSFMKNILLESSIID